MQASNDENEIQFYSNYELKGILTYGIIILILNQLLSFSLLVVMIFEASILVIWGAIVLQLFVEFAITVYNT